MASSFEILAWAPDAASEAALAAAAGRAGAVGLQRAGGPPGWRVGRAPGWCVVEAEDAAVAERAGEWIARWKAQGHRVLWRAVDAEDAETGLRAGADGLVAKGTESGGRVGTETAFLLFQRLVKEFKVPVWVQGGIGFHTAAACRAGGAAGVLVDWQLALARESRLSGLWQEALRGMEGAETQAWPLEDGRGFRLWWRQPPVRLDPLRRAFEALALERRLDWLASHHSWESPEDGLLPCGMDAALAAEWAAECRSAARMLAVLRERSSSGLRAAARSRPLARESGAAAAWGTRYPVLQGPMTRVSDNADFAAAVAEAGAVPFLAAALMRACALDQVLAETGRRLEGRPWGVGLLAFAPPALLEEQLAVVRRHRPPQLILAGGRPDQALPLLREGLACHVHVPSPALLEAYAEAGLDSFILEGLECGGHTGPRSSFLLWEQAFARLSARARRTGTARAYQVILAGGIHDGRSAAMALAAAGPLLDAGVRVGLLMGSAYVLTREAVATGAVTPLFQEQALACRRTTLLESGAGYATRCAATPFAGHFEAERRRLLAEGRSASEVREALELLNLGRLRVASKGLKRPAPEAPLEPVPAREQEQEGLFMMGQVVALHDAATDMESLHRSVCEDGAARLEAAAEALPSEAAVDEEAAPASDRQAVAVVGLAGVFPGAPDLEAYWDNILNRARVLREVPPSRWDAALYYQDAAAGAAPDKIHSRWGGFIDPVPFDPMAYGMPPKTLESIDPVQLVSLEVVAQALRDAGVEPGQAPDRTALIFGASSTGDLGNRYFMRSLLPVLRRTFPELQGVDLESRLPQWTEDSFAGNLVNVITGRVASRLDLRGANFTVDAACASSLASVVLAVRELRSGQADLAVAGGVDLAMSPLVYLSFARTHALSPEPEVRALDRGARGIALGEGVGAVVLKRLADARRDGDRIYAVIRGVSSVSDGRGMGVTAPRHEGQVATLRQAYADAGFGPETVGLFEMHATGTPVGDQVEAEGLRAVLDGAAARRIAVGSVKSMIGHAKCAAGIASFLKAVLAVDRGILPPTMHVERPIEPLAGEDQPLFANTEALPWLASGGPRRAGVSAFGFGGTNFHAVLEAAEGEGARAGRAHWPTELFVWRGETREALRRQVEAWQQRLERRGDGEEGRLGDWAWTCHAERRPGPHVLAVVASSLEDLQARLERALPRLEGDERAWSDGEGMDYRPEPLAGKLVFLFPGQGAQRPGMLRELVLAFPELRQRLEEAEAGLGPVDGRGISEWMYPRPAFDAAGRRGQEEALRRTDRAQPALGAAGWALARWLEGWGLRPELAAGHSYGEITALWAAGAVGDADFFKLTRERAWVMVAHGCGGGMLAVKASPAELEARLAGRPGVWVSNANAPEETVLSGESAALAAVQAELAAQGRAAVPLRVAAAFHCPLMEAAMAPWRRVLEATPFEPPRIPVTSSRGPFYSSDPAEVRETFARQMTEPVEFIKQVRGLHAAGGRIFLELGPSGYLAGMAGQTLAADGAEALVLACEQRQGHSLTQWNRVLGRLLAAGVPVRDGRRFEGRGLRRLEPRRERPTRPLWLVDGSGAWPSGAPRAAGAVPLQPSSSLPPPPPELVMKHDSTPTNGHAAPPAPAALPPQALQLLREHRALMEKFLQTQEQIMTEALRSLGGGAASAGAPAWEGSALDEGWRVVDHAAPPAALRVEAAVPAVSPSANGRHAAPPAPPVPSDREAFTRQLLRTVSEKTGYPEDVLGMDMDLEGDLGVDSIKRVEILAGLQGHMPEMGMDPETMTEEQKQNALAALDKLASLKTLTQIVDWHMERTAQAPPSAGAEPGEISKADGKGREAEEAPDPAKKAGSRAS